MKKNIFFIIYLVSIFALGQNTIKQNFDPFSYSYKYLDKNFKINIDSKDFDEKVEKLNLIKEVENYKDSLAVLLYYEFENDYQAYQKSLFQLTYTWKRLSYHLWECEQEIKKIAFEKKIYYPYQFKQFLLNNPDDEVSKALITSLTDKLEKHKIRNFRNLEINELLNLAMRENQNRINDLKSTEGHKKVCNKEDCCSK